MLGSQGSGPGSVGVSAVRRQSSATVVVGLVELCDGLGFDEMFGRHMEAVGVALDRLKEPGRWVVELPEHGAGGERRFIAGEDLVQRLGRCAR